MFYHVTIGKACAPATYSIFPNQPNLPVMKNDRWYAVEMYMKIDTACTNATTAGGCNGIIRVWIDNRSRSRTAPAGLAP